MAYFLFVSFFFFLLVHASFNELLNFTSGTGTFKKFVTFLRRDGSVQWSVATEQEQSEHGGERWDQAAAPQRSRR